MNYVYVLTKKYTSEPCRRCTALVAGLVEKQLTAGLVEVSNLSLTQK